MPDNAGANLRAAPAVSTVSQAPPKAEEPAKSPVMDQKLRDHIVHWTRYYSDRSDRMYQDRQGFIKVGADATDAEMYRQVAGALRKVLQGANVEEAVASFKKGWKDFQAENNAKVNAAPKIKYGPSSGHSVIGHKWAGDSMGEQGEGIIRRVANGRI